MAGSPRAGRTPVSLPFALAGWSFPTDLSVVYSEPQLARLAKLWAKIHNASAKMPSVVLLGLSGFIMNFVVSWVRQSLVISCLFPTSRSLTAAQQFHKDDAKLQREFEARKKRPATETPEYAFRLFRLARRQSGHH